MAIFRSTIWLSLLLALLCGLASAAPAHSLEAGTSCLTAWKGEDCGQSCALASLQPKDVACPICHHHPGFPQPANSRGQVLNPNKRLDQTSFVVFGEDPGERNRRTPPPQRISTPRRPQLPNQTLAALGTVVLRN